MKLQRVSQMEQPELADAMRPYLAELAKIEGDQPEAVTLDYSYLPLYWTESGARRTGSRNRGTRLGSLSSTGMPFCGAVPGAYRSSTWRRPGGGKASAGKLPAPS
jgi:hypothetical protein